MNILGINAYHGDASAALVVDGQLVAAVEEEWFTRLKHDTSFPHRSIRYCLETAGLRSEEIDHLALSRNPKANLGKRVAHALKDRAGRQVAPRRAANLRKILGAKATLAQGLGVPASRLKAKPHFVEHHPAHIGSSFYVSPFDRAAVLSIDVRRHGVGDVGPWRRIEAADQWGGAFPHFARRLLHGGHPVPRVSQVRRRVQGPWGSPPTGRPSTWTYSGRSCVVMVSATNSARLLPPSRRGHSYDGDGGPPELPPLWGPGMERDLGPARGDGPLKERHQNIAASLQQRLEEVVLGMLRELHSRTKVDVLCLAGGVALNCVVNGKIFDETPFRDVYIQAAAYDGGTSIGAAYYVHHHLLGASRSFVMDHAYYGPEFNPARVQAALDATGIVYQELDEHDLIERTADALSEGEVVGGTGAGWSSAHARWATARS